MKSHNIQICHLLIEASDIKATSMVLNQIWNVKPNVSGVEFHVFVVALISRQLYIVLLDIVYSSHDK
jgi:hypothetical protein